MAVSKTSQLISSATGSPKTSVTFTTADSDKEFQCSSSPDFNVFIIALSVIQNEVTHDCRRVATLILSGFLVVGILLIIPAILQTAAAYLWIGQCRKQFGHQPKTSNRTDGYSSVPTVLRQKNVTNMTRTLFVYRILACVASLLVLLCSTLPQLVLAVANPPRIGNIDQLWGWCHTLVYMDHVTRSFATYMIVVPYVLFFWDFLFSEVVPRRRLVMKHIFHAILISALPLALFSSIVAIPLVIFRYERFWNGTHNVCLSSITGTTNFLLFDFAITRVAPMVIIIIVTSAFLIWLPRHHYGVFYEPLIFFLLMAPIVFLEATIYITCYVGVVHYLVNEQFANVLLIFYAFYHMSFSSTFVLATLRSVVTEIRHERKARKRFLLGGQSEDDNEGNDRRSNVMLGLQRQYSVVFRWRSECAEDELHLEEHLKVKKTEVDLEAPPNPDEIFDHEFINKKPQDDVTLHYSILQRSATFNENHLHKSESSSSPKLQSIAGTRTRGSGQKSSTNKESRPPLRNSRERTITLCRSPTYITPRPSRRSCEICLRTGSLRSIYNLSDHAILPSTSSPRNVLRASGSYH